jgi:hypothetical protein
MHYKTRGMLNRSQQRMRNQEAAENAEFYRSGGTFEQIMGPDVIERWKQDADYLKDDRPKAAWRVTAGASPQELDPELERSWVYSVRDHQSDLFRSDGLSKFDQRSTEVMEYVLALNRHPTKARFCRAEFWWV